MLRIQFYPNKKLHVGHLVLNFQDLCQEKKCINILKKNVRTF